MADYLQPGGARIKFTKEEKDSFLFKVKNMNKEIIGKYILESLSARIDNKITIVNFLKNLIESHYLHGCTFGK